MSADGTARKRVFILGGGAALGAHQVGALKYLSEQGIVPDAIVASSIGVINACAYASGGIPALEAAWREFRSLPQIVSPSWQHNPIFGLSMFSLDRSPPLGPSVLGKRTRSSSTSVSYLSLTLSLSLSFLLDTNNNYVNECS